MYAHKHAGRASASRQVKDALLGVLAVRDPELTRHAVAVADRAEAISRILGLDQNERETVRLAAELHEAGQLMLPPGAASSDHEVAAAGERIIAAAPALVHAARVVGTLHERWDGTGLPDGLAGDAIPLSARIVAVADAYETLTAAAIFHTQALEEIQRAAGTRFDPCVVEALSAATRTRAAAIACA